MTKHTPWEYQAHVTDEWQTDTLVVQVRQMHRGHTSAVGQVMEDRDGVATMHFNPLPEAIADGREHTTILEPTPGLRLRHDVAVTMARAILTEAGKDADEVERLKGEVANLQDLAYQRLLDVDRVSAERDLAKREVEMLERLLEAKDAHLEREARVATLHVRDAEQDLNEGEVAAARMNHPAFKESEAQAVVRWATEVASSTGRELSEVLASWEQLNAQPFAVKIPEDRHRQERIQDSIGAAFRRMGQSPLGGEPDTTPLGTPRP